MEMSFEKIEAPSMIDLFVEAIEKKILSGELKTGERLLPERVLSEKMGVSLAVVHNGLKRLETLGFVRIVPRQGTFIEDFVRCGGVGTLNELIKYAGAGYDMSVIRQFGDLRKLLEIHFYKDACANRSEEEMLRLKDILDRYLSSTSISERADLYFDFVHEVSIACGNIVSPMLLMTFRDLYISFFKGLSRFEDHETMNAYMTDLFLLIENRDCEKIEAEVEKKIDLWLASYSKYTSAPLYARHADEG